MTELYKEPKSGLWVRNKGDEGVVAQMKDYKSLLGCGVKNPVILDLGGYIGTFAWWAAKNLDPNTVISVEPDPSNLEVFNKNMELVSRNNWVVLYDAACTMTDGDTLPLYLGKTYASCNSLEPFRGRQKVDVETVSFKRLLEKHQPDIIKCDIEGGEFGLDWTNLPEYVKFIVMEIHQQRPAWIEQMKEIDQQLLDQGFEHVVTPKHATTFHKVDIGAWKRMKEHNDQ